MTLRSRLKSFLKNTAGASLIEMAIALPVFILITGAVLEFGIYFTKYVAAQRAVSVVANAAQSAPLNTDVATLAINAGTTLVPFKAGLLGPNTENRMTMCTTTVAPAPGAVCPPSAFDFSPPLFFAGTPYVEGQPYYVIISAFVKQNSLTGMVDFILPDIRINQVVLRTPTGNNGGSGLTPPLCNGPNQALQFDGTAYTCAATASQFGGIFMLGTGPNGGFNQNGCRYPNPITGSCTCPTGFAPVQFWEFVGDIHYYYGTTTLWQCVNNTGIIPGGPGPGGPGGPVGGNNCGQFGYGPDPNQCPCPPHLPNCNLNP